LPSKSRAAVVDAAAHHFVEGSGRSQGVMATEQRVAACREQNRGLSRWQKPA
jgi:hypothetical protein